MPQINDLLYLSLPFNAILCIGISFAWLVVYRCFFHALAAIPGPFLARFSSVWLCLNDFGGNGSETLLRLHKKHGQVIRIGPNEVSYLDMAAYNDIYGQKTKFLKEEAWYHGIIPKNAVNMFTTCDAEMHSLLRRLFSHPFSRTNVINFQPMINEHVNIALEHASRRIAEGQPIPTYHLAASFTLDTISRICFGDYVGALRQADLDHRLINSLDALLCEPIVLLRTHYPLFCLVPRRGSISKMAGLLKIISDCLDRAEDYGKDSGEVNLIQNVSTRAVDAGFDLTKDRKISILFQFVTAGFGTTAVTIAGILQHVMRNPDIYNRLHKELATLSPDKKAMMTIYQIESIPYFEACIKEGFRVVCASPLRMPRVVPEGGYDFGGYRVPAGVTVSSSNYFRCFDEQFYPDPHRFIPDRWLSENANALNASWLPFSKGTRSCIGQHMSMVETKLFVAHFIRRFEPVEFIDDFKTWERLVVQPATPLQVRLREA